MKLPHRRQFLYLAAGAAALPVAPHVARAQAYPTRPVRIVVGFGAGGAIDITARIIGQWLSERLGQQFIVENRPGAASNLATEAVVRGLADGYTLLMVNSSAATNATLYPNLNFNFIRDIAPIAGIMRIPNVMSVHPTFAAKTVPEFTAYGKANPDKINFGSGGSGSSVHMAGELFKMLSGINMVHVPYRTEALALTDLLGGQLQVMFGTMAASVEYVRAGKLRALAVSTPRRSDELPDVPALSEFVPGYETGGWVGIGAPKATPPALLARLNTEINAALTDVKIKSQLTGLGGMALGGSPADFGQLIQAETERSGKVIKFAGIKAE
jgi:tripartite-type tricarboxylate transporter receptor subunit TctC